MKIKFLGAASTVTGSKHILDFGENKFLIDCGQLQGPEASVDVTHIFDFKKINEISCVFITHAHIDHCGYLPYIVKKGFRGAIYTTLETFELMKISLDDAADLLRESVNVDNRKEQFFFDKNDVHTMLSRVKIVEKEKIQNLHGVDVSFHHAGHILGACFVKFKFEGKVVVFSGDLGRSESTVHPKPLDLGEVDCLVIESTYGDKIHVPQDFHQYFLDLFNETMKKGATLIIPAFSIDRTQMLLNIMSQVVQDNDLKLPIILTGSMGLQVTKVYEKFSENLKITKEDFLRIRTYTREIYYQNELQHFWETASGAKVVIAGGGMLSGGTILGHLKNFGIYESSIILITGYQANDTLGRMLLNGERKVQIEKKEYEIKSEVRFLPGLSAHADQKDMLNWIKTSNIPATIFLVHGEENSRKGFKQFLDDNLKAKIILPKEGECYKINGEKEE